MDLNLVHPPLAQGRHDVRHAANRGESVVGVVEVQGGFGGGGLAAGRVRRLPRLEAVADDQDAIIAQAPDSIVPPGPALEVASLAVATAPPERRMIGIDERSPRCRASGRRRGVDPVG